MSKIVFAFRVDPTDEKQWQEIYKRADTKISYREFIYKATKLGIERLEKNTLDYDDFKRTLATLLRTEEGQEILRKIVELIEKEE